MRPRGSIANALACGAGGEANLFGSPWGWAAAKGGGNTPIEGCEEEPAFGGAPWGRAFMKGGGGPVPAEDLADDSEAHVEDPSAFGMYPPEDWGTFGMNPWGWAAAKGIGGPCSPWSWGAGQGKGWGAGAAGCAGKGWGAGAAGLSGAYVADASWQFGCQAEAKGLGKSWPVTQAARPWSGLPPAGFQAAGQLGGHSFPPAAAKLSAMSALAGAASIKPARPLASAAAAARPLLGLAAAAASSGPREVPRISLAEYDTLPRIVVFDLDETCWNHFGLDFKPAFKPPFAWCDEQGGIVDSNLRPVKIFPELPTILLALHEAGVPIAVASHSGKPEWCRQIFDSFVLEEGLTWGSLVPQELTFIKWSGEFWPGKNGHLKHIQKGCPGGPCEFSEMLFFDDSRSIISQAWKLGVTGVRCNGGVSVERLKDGLKQLAAKGVKRKAELVAP